MARWYWCRTALPASMPSPVRGNPMPVGARQAAEATRAVPRHVHEDVPAGCGGADLEIVEPALREELCQGNGRGSLEGGLFKRKSGFFSLDLLGNLLPRFLFNTRLVLFFQVKTTLINIGNKGYCLSEKYMNCLIL